MRYLRRPQTYLTDKNITTIMIQYQLIFVG